MAARVNTRFVTILSLVLIGLTAALGLTYALVRPSPEERITQARALEQQGQHDEALLQYERALAREKNNFDFLIEYADSLERYRTTDSYNAEKALSKLLTALMRASDLRPDDQAVWDRLAKFRYDVAAMLGNVASWNALYDLAQRRLEIKPQDMTALRYRGIAQVARTRLADLNAEQRQQGKNDLEQIWAQNTEDAEIAFRLATWHLNEAAIVEQTARDSKVAEDLRQQAVTLTGDYLADHPDDLTAQINHGRVLVSADRRDEAMAVLELAEARLLAQPTTPEDMRVVSRLLVLADQRRVALSGGDGYTTVGQQRATILLEKAAQTWPHDILTQVALGGAYQNEARLEESIATFRGVAQQAHASTPLDTYATTAARESAQLSLANLLLTRAGRTEDQAERLEALTPARQALDSLPQRLADSARVKALRGKLALIEGKYHEALRLLNDASNQLGDRDIEILLLSASASQKINQYGEAARRLSQVLELNPDLYNQRVSLARLYVRNGQLDQAERQINLLRQANPTDAVPVQLMAAVHLSRGQPARAIEIFEALQPDQNRPIAVRLANLYLAGDRKADALRLLRRLVDEDPSDAQALQLLLRTTTDTDEREAALKRAADAGVDPQVLRVLEAQFVGGEEAMEQLFDNLLADMQEEDPFQWNLTQYRMLLQNGKVQEARAHLAKAAGMKPDHPQVIEARFNEALNDGDLETAGKLVEKARQLNLDQAEGQFFRGKLLVVSGDGAGAVNAFRRGLALRPVYSEGWQMLGGALQAEGNSEAAEEAFLRALDQRPDNVTAMRGLARAQANRGEHAAAIDTLRRAITLAPNDRDLRNVYLTFIETYGNAADALTPRQQLAQERPDDYSNRRALARLLVRLNRPQEAIATINALIADEGLTRTNVLTAATIKAQSGQALEARDMMTGFVNNLGAEASWSDWAMLGHFLLRINAVQEAQQAFAKAMELEDPIEKQATRQLADALFQLGYDRQAVSLYEQVVEAKPEDPRAQLRLIEALVRSADVDAAQARLNAFVGKFGATATTQMLQGALLTPRAQAAVVAGRFDEASALREQALDAFNRAIEQQPRNAVAYYHRAALLRANPENDAQVISDLRQAVALDPDLLQARRMLAEVHVMRNELVDAERELRTVLDRNPDSAQNHAELAELLLAQQRYAPLRRLLDDAATRFPTDPTWPQWKARLAAIEGRTADHLALMRQAFELVPTPPLLADLVTATLSARQPQQALALLDANEQAATRQPVLQAIRARVLAALGRPDEAVASARQAIEQSTQIFQLEAVTDQLIPALGTETAMRVLEETSTGERAPATQLMVARIEALLGRYDASLVRLKQVREAVPADSPVQAMVTRLMASSQMAAGQYAAAIENFKQMIEQSPNNVEALNNVAFLLADNLDRGAEALPYAERAAALAPRSAEILDTLGWVQYKAGQPTVAIETLRRSVARQPGAHAEMHMGIILAELGQTAVARSHLESARAMAEESNNQQLLAAIDAQLESLGGGTR